MGTFVGGTYGCSRFPDFDHKKVRTPNKDTQKGVFSVFAKCQLYYTSDPCVSFLNFGLDILLDGPLRLVA